MPLRFALAVGKELINAPKPFIEILSIKGVYVSGVKTILLPLFPVRDVLPELDSTAKAIATEINDSDIPRICLGDDVLLKPDTRYCFSPDSGEAKVHSRAASDSGSDSEDSSISDKSSDNRSNEDEANAEPDVQYATTTVNPFRVPNETSQYCTALALKKIKEEPVADSEIITNGTFDESGDNRLNEDESDVQYETTTLNPFRVSNEFSQYGATLALKKIKEEPVADSEIITNGTSDESIDNRLNEDESDVQYETTTLNPFRVSNEFSQYGATLELKKIKQEPDSDQTGHLKKHEQPHLCDYQKPKKPKVHQCDHEGCDYRTDRTNNLKKHKQTHLPADQRLNRPRVHQCDHEGCHYRTYEIGNLNTHKQTHLPADQRLKRKASDQPPFNQKRKKGDKE